MLPEDGRIAVAWSAGKDCCLALLRLREQGAGVETCVTMCEPDGRSKAHALSAELVAAQVAAFGGRWLPVRVPPGEYAATFDATLRTLRETGHTRMAFGDVDLQAHRDWIEAACAKAGPFVFDAPGMSAPLSIRDGARREAASSPPFAPTVQEFQELALDGPRPAAQIACHDGGNRDPGRDAGGAIVALDLADHPLRLDGLALVPQADAAWQLRSPNKACGMTDVRAAYAIAPRGGEALASALRALCEACRRCAEERPAR